MRDEDGTAGPFFTVVVPTFERDAFLREALASVRDQTFRSFEVVVVDDGPNASTRDVVESFNDERFSYTVNEGDKGGSGARNTGGRRARGEWIAFLDDDDAWLPTKLEAQHRKIGEVGPEVGLVYTGHVRYDFERSIPKLEIRPQARGWIRDELLYRNVIGGFHSVAVRRDVFERVGGLDERFPSVQDAEFYVRVAEVCAVDFVPEPLVRVRRGSERRISTNARKKLVGSQLFWTTFEHDIRSDGRLSHRAAARVFVHALDAGDLGAMARSFAWTWPGLVFDPRDAVPLVRTVASIIVRRVRARA